MGVDGLYKFINKNFPDVYNTVGISEIRGKSCVIDGMQHIYSQLIYMRSREKEVLTPDGKNISHIHGLINSLTYYLKNDIIPIFVFDGKTPDIKKKKIEERKKNLKDNLHKLKELQKQKNNLNEYINYFNADNVNQLGEQIEKNDNEYIYGTPPSDSINLEEEITKINNIQEEYKKIYKKSIVMKDYYIKDWIQILQLLGLPVIKAEGEADPLCAYLLKNNSHIYGIISDDSDMLVFGSPVLMRKSVNQQFTIIELEKLLTNIEILLTNEYGTYKYFDSDNLVDFSILLGTDYGNFKTNKVCYDSLELLKYYVSNDYDYKKIISSEQYEKFDIIKKYYTDCDYSNECKDFINKPVWNKPNLMDLKKRLLELDVDEDYIDKNNEFLDLCYNKINKRSTYSKFAYKKMRSNSFDSQTNNYEYKYSKNSYSNNINNTGYGFFKRLSKNPTFYSDKYYVVNKNKEIKKEVEIETKNKVCVDISSNIVKLVNDVIANNREKTNETINTNVNNNVCNNRTDLLNSSTEPIEKISDTSAKSNSDDDIFHFEN